MAYCTDTRVISKKIYVYSMHRPGIEPVALDCKTEALRTELCCSLGNHLFKDVYKLNYVSYYVILITHILRVVHYLSKP